MDNGIDWFFNFLYVKELDDITLCLEWTKLREENNRLYEINN
uniref:Uncharacterized protein n=1 Tax=Escherichia coli TaxID=562 RepID=A0A2R4A8W6_ECOLX|nr:hypothetical protein [Escherichia coli]